MCVCVSVSIGVCMCVRGVYHSPIFFLSLTLCVRVCLRGGGLFNLFLFNRLPRPRRHATRCSARRLAQPSPVCCRHGTVITLVFVGVNVKYDALCCSCSMRCVAAAVHTIFLLVCVGVNVKYDALCCTCRMQCVAAVVCAVLQLQYILFFHWCV